MNIFRRIRHAITGEHTWRYEPAQAVLSNGRVYGPWFHCPICGATRKALDEPPADHPDSMAPLPPEQEKQLAALEAALAKGAAQ